MVSNEIERMFREEVRDKKITGYGIHSRKGKRGYVGKMMFPTDFMSRKEKQQYRKAGKVVTTNLYDEITMNYNQWKVLKEEDQKKYMQEWRNRFTLPEISEKLGAGESTIWSKCKQLGITSGKRGYRKRTAVTKTTILDTGKQQTIDKQPVSSIAVKPIEVFEPMVIPKTNGMHLSLTGTYAAEEIVRKLTNFSVLLSEEKTKFDIKFFVQEVEK